MTRVCQRVSAERVRRRAKRQNGVGDDDVITCRKKLIIFLLSDYYTRISGAGETAFPPPTRSGGSAYFHRGRQTMRAGENEFL